MAAHDAPATATTTAQTPGRARDSGQLRRLAAAAAGLVLARECAGCGAPDVLLCPSCTSSLAGAPFLAWPTPTPPGLPPPIAVGPYEGVVRSMLLAHKEDCRLALARPLGAALGRAVLIGAELSAAGSGGGAARGGRDTALRLVPAPSRAAAVRARGHDATLRLARAAAASVRSCGVDTEVLPVVRAARGVADQAGLSAAAREANLGGALRVPDRFARFVRDQTVVVVDDVITSGATLAECARALRGVGADVVMAATIAATARRAPAQR